MISNLLLLIFGLNMSTTDHAFLMNHLEESEAYLLSMLEDVEAQNWTYKKEEGIWSIGECAEHILVSERALLHNIQTQIQQEEAVKKEAKQTNEMVLNAVYDRVNKRVKTIEPLEPKGTWKSKAEFLTAFKDARKKLRQFIETNNKNLDHYFTDSPIGEVSLYQNLLVLSAHTARHTHQIEDLKKELGLSTAMIRFGGSVKVNIATKERANIQRFFGEILNLKIEETENYDRVLFDGGGYVAFVYQEDAAQVLDKSDFAKSMQVGLLIPRAHFESIKRRLVAFGADAHQPPFTVDESKYYFFHAPGGQIFRLVKKG